MKNCDISRYHLHWLTSLETLRHFRKIALRLGIFLAMFRECLCVVARQLAPKCRDFSNVAKLARQCKWPLYCTLRNKHTNAVAIAVASTCIKSFIRPVTGSPKHSYQQIIQKTNHEKNTQTSNKQTYFIYSRDAQWMLWAITVLQIASRVIQDHSHAVPKADTSKNKKMYLDKDKQRHRQTKIKTNKNTLVMLHGCCGQLLCLQLASRVFPDQSQAVPSTQTSKLYK